MVSRLPLIIIPLIRFSYKGERVRPGAREISPMSIYGETYGGKDFMKR